MRITRSFAGSIAAGIAVAAAIGAARPPAAPTTLRPVEVTLHRFDIAPGQEGKFREWIAFLQARHRDAVATLGRERTYFEAMFTDRDEPRQLYGSRRRGPAANRLTAPTSTSIAGMLRIWARSW